MQYLGRSILRQSLATAEPTRIAQHGTSDEFERWARTTRRMTEPHG